MKADIECLDCCVNKVSGLLDQYQADDRVREAVLEKVKEILKQADKDVSAPVLMQQTVDVLEDYFEIDDAYTVPKEKYNRYLMEREEQIRQTIRMSRDPFLTGLQYAVTGNYIDFGAMSDVNEEKLAQLLADYDKLSLDTEEIERLRGEVSRAKSLVYITDNAGEIVLDKLFIEAMKGLHPGLEVTVLVRGFPTLNDATKEDAAFIGMPEIAEVLTNGIKIPGTPLDRISKEALDRIKRADLCIAKGQGNFETLRGCGENIYYLFLCKCTLFVKKFQVARFTPVLGNEKRIVQYA